MKWLSIKLTILLELKNSYWFLKEKELKIDCQHLKTVEIENSIPMTKIKILSETIRLRRILWKYSWRSRTKGKKSILNIINFQNM